MVLLTTTVSVDSQKTGDQVEIHLVMGDAGTRRFLMVPTSGGSPISMANVTAAKIQAQTLDEEDTLLINCQIENGKVYWVPTSNLVGYVSEWECQLVLLNSSDETLHSIPFTVIVHDAMYTGDTVEHTNTKLSDASWDENTETLTLTLADGTSITVGPLTHDHPLVTASEKGFMSPEQFTNLATLVSRVDQALNTTSRPTFDRLTVGDVIIYSNGAITGATFT